MAKMDPWYNRKRPEHAYLVKGEPVIIEGENGILDEIPKWVPPTTVDMEMWKDHRSVVLSRNKKKDYHIQFREPVKLANGNFYQEIKILHLDYRGFVYMYEGASASEVQKRFWPTVAKIMAYLVGPQLRLPPNHPGLQH